jgi:hypothetical protein
VKAEIGSQPYFLHQWDQAAERFQPIGGKKRDSETHSETALREFCEEMSDQDMLYNRRFDLSLITEAVRETEISRTYGSLTEYNISIYQAMLSSDSLSIGVSDRWISLREINEGKTEDGRDVSPFCRRLNEARPKLLENMPFSIKLTQSRNLAWLDSLDIKPGMFGIRIDLKRILLGLKK